MVKFKSSLIISIILLLLPTTTGEVEIEANGESDLVFVDAGGEVAFSAKGLRKILVLSFRKWRNYIFSMLFHAGRLVYDCSPAQIKRKTGALYSTAAELGGKGAV